VFVFVRWVRGGVELQERLLQTFSLSLQALPSVFKSTTLSAFEIRTI